MEIDTDGKIYLKVDEDKKCYVKLPDNSVITSTDGVIEKNWGGELGNIILYVPKNTLELWINSINHALHTPIGGDYIGKLKTNLATELYSLSCTSLTSINAPLATNLFASSCPNLTSINAPMAISLDASGCPSLTTSSIYGIFDNAYSLFENGKLNGTINLGGTTTSINNSTVSSVHAKTYLSMITEMTTAGWNIKYNVN